MGALSRSKHPSRKKGQYAGGANEGRQTTIPTSRSQGSELEVLLPIIKEIGKALYPPAAIPIEILYQLYTHVEAIGEVASAVMEGDYERAAVVVVREATKELAQAALEKAESPVVEEAESIASAFAKNTVGDEQEKEIVGEVAKGTVKGVVKASNKKIVDKAAQEVLKWKEEKQG